MLFGVFVGTVKASFPTTLSNNIEELRQGIHRNPHAFNQGLNESCKFFQYVPSYYVTYKLVPILTVRFS